MPLGSQFKNTPRVGLFAKLGRGKYDPALAAKLRPAEPRAERAIYLKWVTAITNVWKHVVLARFDLAATPDRRFDADLFSADWDALIDSGGFDGMLDRIATSIADRNQTYFQKVVKNPVPRTGARGQMIEDFRKRNVALIKNVGAEQVVDLNTTLAKANAQGLRHEEIAAQIQDRLKVGTSRAKLIARDQTLKYNASVHQAQAEASGITRYRWSTSHDAEVRSTHKVLDGHVFIYADPPVTNDAGDRNNPGEDYQCRCAAIPIIDLFADIDAEPDAPDAGLLPSKPDPLISEVSEIGVQQTSYLRTGMRPASQAFADQIYAGVTSAQAQTIASALPDPVRMEIWPNGGRRKIVLGDGRHRVVAAAKAGATSINARVVEYGPRGAVRREIVGPVRL